MLETVIVNPSTSDPSAATARRGVAEATPSSPPTGLLRRRSGLAARTANTVQLGFFSLLLALKSELALIPGVLAICFLPAIIGWIGFPLILGALLWLRWDAGWARRFTRVLTGRTIEEPYRPLRPGLIQRLLGMLRDPATWRELLWSVIVAPSAGFALTLLPATFFFGALFYFPVWPFLFWTSPANFDEPMGFWRLNSMSEAIVFGLVMAAVMAVGWRLTARPLLQAYSRLNAQMLGLSPNAAMKARVQHLTTTRSETLDTSAAELRRIERDLHDGPQARLAALSMHLGLAEELIEHDPERAVELLADARSSASDTLTELRTLVRGILPPVLADRGLGGALEALAISLPIPVQLSVDLPKRPPAPVESALYFACAEAMANTVKHAAATKAWLDVHVDGDSIRVLAGDDGVGGAEVTPGGGLDGIRKRLAAFDGTVDVSSPIGGPTIVIMRVPN